jgi:hypothetical protein
VINHLFNISLINYLLCVWFKRRRGGVLIKGKGEKGRGKKLLNYTCMCMVQKRESKKRGTI